MPETTSALTVDGHRLAVQDGETLLQAMLRGGIEIAHVCYHPQLGPLETCDTCIVEADGELVRACATKAYDGLRVRLHSDSAREAREEAMQRILHNHELYCTVCDNNNGDCIVHNATKLLQITRHTHPFEPKPAPHEDNTNPFYRYDADQCILCGRCVEACQNLEVNETLSIDWSLERPRVVWDDHKPIGDSSCVSCGHCVTACPCNALMEKTMLGEAGQFTNLPDRVRRPMIELVEHLETSLPPVFAISDVEAATRESSIKRTKTVCTYCAVGCSFDVWTRGRKILKIDPQVEAPANGISTCIKGKFGWDYVNSPDRLREPLIRKDGQFVTATWDEAIDLVARRLREIKEAHGPDALAFIASSKGSNEEAFLTQKLARQVIGTNNVDNDSTYCQDPATYGLRNTVGFGADSGSIRDIELAELVIAIGSNTAESHPVVATRVKRSHKLHGQKLIVVDVRKHEMADRADLFIRPKPGTDAVWLLGVQRYLRDQGWLAKEFLSQRVEGVDAYLASLDPYDLGRVERETGVPQEQTKQAARMIHEAGSVCALWAMGITQQRNGSAGSLAISNMLLLTGNFGRPGTGGYPLRGHNNVQGASDMGAKPGFLPGYQSLRDDAAKRRYEAAWGTPMPQAEGINNVQLADEIHAGKVRGLYIVGEETALVDNDADHTQEALAKVDFLVVQEIFLTRTAQFADVILPACPNLEKEGTFTNTERRMQRFYQALEPLGGARPDWQILQEVANRLGGGWHYEHPSEIMDEIARLSPMFAGLSYQRLEHYRSLQWPVAADGTDSPLLYKERFNHPSGKAKLVPVEIEEPHSFDLRGVHVNNGQLLEHFHEGNMTYRVPGIAELVPSVFLEVSPELAQQEDLEDGDVVRLASPAGDAEVPVLVTDRVAGEVTYLPMNDRGEGAINRLTGMARDPETMTPAYKGTSAKLEKTGRHLGHSPLPLRNWRFQQRHPQPGVRVEEKWRRSDYEPLTGNPAQIAKEAVSDGSTDDQSRILH
ncbi:MAG: formate dehydrogenase subunit alpha [Thermaerobacter sp.]|nr:formate dehydrogenase subunit alpha [Thermaerobacter sp.]